MSITREDIRNQYRIWLNREADESGLNNYWNHVQNGWQLSDISNELNTSEEFERTAGAQVDTWYQEILGRAPDSQGRADYIQMIRNVGFEQLEPIRQSFYQSDEYVNANGPAPHPDGYLDTDFIIPGVGGDKFGDADYYNLLANAEQNGLQALKDVRDDVLDWLDNHPRPATVLHENNFVGEENGLYDRILKSGRHYDGHDSGKSFFESGDHFQKFGDPERDLNKNEYFEKGDILAARAGGHSEYQIYNYMQDHKDQWDVGNADLTRNYNDIRNALIEHGNKYGNMGGNEEWADLGTGDGRQFYSWRHSLENPLWQAVGDYIRGAGWGDHHTDSLDWWRHNKDAYYEIRDFLRERSDNHDWLESHGGGLSTQDQLDDLIGVAGQAGVGGTVSPGGNWPNGEYWNTWGALGPNDLSDPQVIATGTGVGAVTSTSWNDTEIQRITDAIEARFLREMFTEHLTDDQDDDSTDTDPPKYTSAQDSWGLDIVRRGMEPSDWDYDWFDNEGNLNDDRFNTLAYGGLDSIDWGFYADSDVYKQAQEALGMDEVIDTVQEIRQANVWVHAALADPTSDHNEEWIPYVRRDLPPVPDPKELAITGYTPELKLNKKPAPDAPDAPNINIPNPKITRPENLPADLTIANTPSSVEVPILPS